MDGVTIVNNTTEKITVSITITDESNGGPGFYEIASKKSSTWKRSKLQVCHVLRADTGSTEVFVVEPGKTYQVEGNTNEVKNRETMSDLLPTSFVGTTGAAVQSTNGNFRVYFQNKDYQIYQMILADPTSTIYTIQKLTNSPIPAARINTPIAAVSWNELNEIRVYYITVDSQVQEMCFSKSGDMRQGKVLGTAAESSAFLYAQVTVNPRLMIRVGFQSSTAPRTITEAVWDKGWNNRVL
jgi:hypothetical protein